MSVRKARFVVALHELHTALGLPADVCIVDLRKSRSREDMAELDLITEDPERFYEVAEGGEIQTVRAVYQDDKFVEFR